MTYTGKNIAEIERLEGEVARLENELAEMLDLLTAARLRASEFKVGDVVLAKRRGARAQYLPAIVREVDVSSWRAPWYTVSFARKNGEWSKSPFHAFDDVKEKES